MQKRVLFILIGLVVVAAAGFYFYSANKSAQGPDTSKNTPPREYQITILYQGKPFVPVIDGFKEGLASYITPADNINITYDIHDVAGDGQAPFDAEVAKIMALPKKPDLFLGIGPNAVNAAKKATTEIPILYAFGGDGADAKFVASLQSSGNNVTGLSWRAYELSGKRLETLKRIDPKIKKVLVFGVKGTSALNTSKRYVDESAKAAGLDITYKLVTTTEEFTAELAKMDRKDYDAVGYMNDPFFVKNTAIFLKAIDEKNMPTIFHDSAFAKQGVLASYGAEYFPSGKQLSRLAKKIIDGELPTNIPSEGTSKITFVINEGTAKKLGITIPEDVLSIVDEVIPASN